jgi:hypothetical protein
MLITTIPFTGFYESVHSAIIDSEMESMFYEAPVALEYFQDNWSLSLEVRDMYCRDYLAAFGQATGLTLAYAPVQSPREYNFSTDRLLAFISAYDAQGLLHELGRDTLAGYVYTQMRTRGDLIPHYSTDLDAWGALATWDYNQVGMLVAAWCDNVHGAIDEIELMEWVVHNGWVGLAVEAGFKGDWAEIDRLQRGAS